MAADVVEQRLDALHGPLRGVLVELQVPVAPVQAPQACAGGIAEPRNRELRPLTPPVPRWPRLVDRDVPIGGFALHPHLTPEMFGHTLSAPRADAQEVVVGNGHASESARSRGRRERECA